MKFEYIEICNKNLKTIVKDSNDIEKQIIIIIDRINIPTQTDSVELKGKINSKGIRLLLISILVI